MKVITPVPLLQKTAHSAVFQTAESLIRLCVNFSTVPNAALIGHRYPLSIQNDISPIFNNGNYFAKVHFTKDYFKVEVFVLFPKVLAINSYP